MRIVVTGSHGLIGSAVVTTLEQQGHQVVRLVRGAAGPGEVTWDPDRGQLDPVALDKVEAAVHLAGAPIAEKRWTEDHKRQILQSRVTTTALLSRRLAEARPGGAVLVSGSAIGFYGDRGEEILDETSPGGSGFLADVCAQWEAATAPAEEAGIRVVHARTGTVLTPEGGALKKQLPLFKVGMGGRFGSGQQYQSWISLPDEVGAIVFALQTPSLTGPVNLTAPHPVTNAEFTRILGAVMGRPTKVAAPKFGLSTVLGRQMAQELLLASQRIVPDKLLAAGYEFQYPELQAALRALLA